MTTNFKIDSQKTLKDNGVGNKVWVDDKGIVNIRVTKLITPEEAFDLIGKAEELLLDFKGEGRVLISIIPYKGPFIATSKFRKDMAERIKRMIKDSNFKKIAIYGGDIVIRTVASFIVSASGVKKMRVFSNQEEAFKWLEKNP